MLKGGAVLGADAGSKEPTADALKPLQSAGSGLPVSSSSSSSLHWAVCAHESLQGRKPMPALTWSPSLPYTLF